MILVTGATGNVGSAVVAELSAKGGHVRAFVRDEQRATERLGGDVELSVGDFEDPASLARALGGVEVVFLSSADQPNKVQHEVAVIDAAAAAGVRRIVKASTVGAEVGSSLPPFDWHGQIEDRLRTSGIPSVVLHSFFYMTNLLASSDPIRQTGKLFAALGGAKIAMVDPRDVGAVGAVALTTDAYNGQTLNISGPEALTYERVADELSAATGRTIDFVDIPDEAAQQALTDAGLPGWLVAHLGNLFPLLRQGIIDQPTEAVRAVTGREPRTFAEWAREHAALFRP
jgi:uncharacterized protein YbjT (DUF2867 family)